MIINDGICFDEEKGYFVDRNTGDLYNIDINTNTIELIDSVKSAEANYRKYRKILKLNEKIICLPDCDRKIKIVNEKNGKSEYIELDSDERNCIVSAWNIGNTIYAGRPLQNELLEIELGTNKKIIKRYSIFNESGIICSQQFYLDNNHIYAITKTKIAAFDISSKEIRVYDYKEQDKGFSTIVCKDNKIYLTGHKNKIYVVDKTNMEIVEKIDIKKEMCANTGYIEDDNYFIESVVCGPYIYFFPQANSNNILFLNNKDNSIGLIEFNYGNKDIKHFTYSGIIDDYFFVQDEINKELYSINITNQLVKPVRVHINLVSMGKKYSQNNKCEEAENLTLNGYLQYLKSCI